MRMRSIVLCLLLVGVYGANFVDAYSTGVTGRTNGCSCHYGGGGFTPGINGLPSGGYVGGTTYSITWDNGGMWISGSGGFNLKSTNSGGSTSMGSWSNLGTNVQQIGNELTHSSDASRSWGADWTAPAAGSGSVQFSLAVLFGNGNGGNSGDSWGTNTITLAEAAGATNTPPVASNLQLSPTNPTVLTGLTLTYTFSDADGDQESGTEVRWYNQGALFHPNNDQLSISVMKDEVWSVEVTPSDGEDFGTMESAGPMTVVNAAPQAQNAQLSPSSPVETDTLSATYQYSDPDQDSESGTSIIWYLDGVRVSELDDTTSVSSLMTRSGDQWQYSVTPHDGTDSGSEVLSNLVIIGSSNNAPSVNSALIGPSNPATNDELNAAWNFVDPDNGDTELDFEIEWYRGGVHIPAFDGMLTLPHTATAKGETWNFEVRVSDGIDWSTPTNSQSVTIVNTVPTVSNVTLSPESPTSSENIEISAIYSDLDGDIESSSTILWYRDGQLQSQFTNNIAISADATNRGEVWMVKYTPSDGVDNGAEVQSESVTIANSLPSIETLSIGENVTALTSLELSLSSQDADDDSLTTTIHWLRDGFQVKALNNQTTVSTDWLGVGQSWTARVILDDGFGESIPVTSGAVVINNIMPTAAFSFTANPLIEAITIFDASESVDSDGQIVAWFWDIGGMSFIGEKISVTLMDSTTLVNLTIVDSNGGKDSYIESISATLGPTTTNLEVNTDNGEVNLNWDWNGDPTTFTVWRSHKPILHSSELLEIEPVGQTNSTTWSEPLHLVGTYQYAITVDVDGVHNPHISTNTGEISLEASQMTIVEPEGESSLGTMLTSLLAFLLIFAALSTALLDRFLGGNS
tara:strand:+ start:418 stop:2994 length:2577 start_codon:yes stop_codon:yes gene_type:complete